MPLSDTPSVAANIINFNGSAGIASQLNYNVPLPGRFRGRRLLRLGGLPIAATDWRAAAKSAAISLNKRIDYSASQGKVSFDEAKARALFIEAARANGIRGDIVSTFEKARALGISDSLPEPPKKPGEPIRKVPIKAAAKKTLTSEPARNLPGIPNGPGGLDPKIVEILQIGSAEQHMQLRTMMRMEEAFLKGLTRGELLLPGAKADGSPEVPASPAATSADPAFYLVEVYAISSFLGDYGLGRTVKTFTLLPGEQMSIKLRTWRSSEAVRKEASSIFDSFGTEASDRFTTEVQRETTDKSTRNNNVEWHADAEVNVAWGFGSAGASGGGSGEENASREAFARNVSNAAAEHARTASSKRETTVTSSSETTEKKEDEEVTERTIRNVNLRRTLNFVFRELNQEYLTKIHLLEFRLAFSNGTGNSWREVPISAMRSLLHEVLSSPAKADEVASTILERIMYVWDKNDTPVRVLESTTFNPDGNIQGSAVEPARINGIYPPPAANRIYRFKKGSLGSQGIEPTALPANTPPYSPAARAYADGKRHSQHTVDGVVLREDQIVLRTDAVVVEALLGQADALDEYAMLAQKADAESKAIANQREVLLNEALGRVTDAEKRAKLFAELARPINPLKIDLGN